MASLETQGALNANDQALCTVQDLSRNGIALETGQPPNVGQAVVLRLALDDEIHELRVRTARVNRQYGTHYYSIGLDWSELSETELSFLDRVLDAMQES